MLRVSRPVCAYVPATPVRALTHGNGVHTLVNTTDTLPAVDISKDGPSRLGLFTGLHLLDTGDLGRLHTSTEAHGGVGLDNTTSHTTGETSRTGAETKGLGHFLHFGRGKEQDGSLRGRLNPGLKGQPLS